MEKSCKIMLLPLMLLACVLMVSSPAAPQEKITAVEDGAFDQRMRPAVSFAHDRHNEAAEIDNCGVCHHVYKDGKKVEGEESVGSECSECHLPPGGGYPFDLVKVYHSMCKGCHQQKKAGPVLCAECHRKS